MMGLVETKRMMTHFGMGGDSGAAMTPDKGLYRSMAQMTKRENVRANWNRIVLHDMESFEVVEDSPRVWFGGLVLLDEWLAERQYRAMEHHRRGTFLDAAKQLDRSSETDAALDLIYDSLEEMMQESRIAQLDKLLLQIDVAEWSSDLLLGFLTATLPMRNSLPSRKQLLKRTESELRLRGEYEQGILVGL